MSRGEAMILVGMMLVIFSVFLVWQVVVPSIALPSAASATLGPLEIPHKGTTVLRGPQWWTLWGCAMLCPLTLMWIPMPKTRLPLAIVQGVCGAVCLAITLLHFAMQPGVLLALVGSALLILGALDRYQNPLKPESKSKSK